MNTDITFCGLPADNQIDLCSKCKRRIQNVPRNKIVSLSAFNPTLIPKPDCAGYRGDK